MKSYIVAMPLEIHLVEALVNSRPFAYSEFDHCLYTWIAAHKHMPVKEYLSAAKCAVNLRLMYFQTPPT